MIASLPVTLDATERSWKMEARARAVVVCVWDGFVGDVGLWRCDVMP